ncbi:MAG: hypothetical protein MJA29_10885, partial [Candidatus Omnitrophica bacterium]|nr:hypothetical protein [Candidatus Omnitrophota bacterium]
MSRAYADKKKVEGIELSEAGVKERIYGQYVKAFEEGAYDLVKTEYDLQNGRSVSRRYVSGGVTFGKLGPGNGIVSFIFDRARRVIDAMREKVETTRVRADFLAAGSAPAETDAGLVTAASSAVKMDGGKSDRLMTKVVTEEGVFLPLGVTFEEIIQEIGGLEKKEGKITEENGRIYLKAPHVLTGGIRGKLLYLAEWAKKISGLAPWDMPEKGLHGDTFAGYMIETAHFDELIIYLKEALLGQIVQEFANHILQGITIKKGTIVDNIFPDENGRILSTEKAAIIVSRMQSELKQYGLTPFATRDSDPAVEHFVHFISSRLVESGIGQMQDGLYYLGDLSAVEGSSYFEGNAGPLEIAGLRKIFRYEKRTNVETVGELIQIFNGKGQNLLQRTAQGVLGILTSRLQRSGSAFRELEVLRDHVRKQLTASVDSPDSIAVKISAPWGSRARRIALSLAAAWQESDPDSITISSEEAIQFIGEIDREQDKILGDMVKGVIERVELDEDKKFFLLPLGFPRVVRGENRKTRIERVVELLEVMRSHLEVPGENVPETEIILNKSVMKFFAQELSKVGIGVVEQNVAEQDVYRVKKDDVFAGHAVLKGVIKEFSGFNLTHSASSAVTQDREVFSEQRVVLRPQDSQETYNYSVEEMIKLLTGMKPSEGGLRDVLREKSTGTRSQKVPTSDPALPIWQALAGSLKFVEIKKGMKSRLHDLNLAPAEWVQEEPWIVIYNPGELNEWLSRQIGGFESLSNGQTLKELRKKKGFDLGLFEVKNEFRYTENGFRMPVFQALRELADWEKRLSAEDATLADSDLWKLFREEYPFLPEFLQDKENVSLVSSEILNKLREIVLQRKNVLFPGLAQAFMGVLEMNDDGSITVPNQYAPMALKREPVEIKQALRIMGIINNALSESPITKEEAIAKPGEARDWFIFQDGEDILMPLGGGALIEYFMSAAAERGIGGIVELNSERFYSFKKEDLDVVRDFWREVHYQLQAKSPTASSAVDAEVVLSLGKIWETLKLKANNRELPANVDIADMAEIARQTILSLLSERGNDISYEEEGGEIVSEMDPSEFFVNDLPELLSWFLMTREIVKWYQTAARELDFSLLTEFESVTQSILPVLSEINTGGKLWLERELRVFPESFPAEEVGTFSADVVRDELTAMRDELEESMRRIRKEGEVRGFAIPMISTGYPHLRAGIMSALVDSGVFPEIKLILFFFFGFYFIPFTDGNSLLEWINQRLDDLHGGRLFGEKEELRVRMSPMVSNDSLKPDDAVKALDEIVASLKKAKA